MKPLWVSGLLAVGAIALLAPVLPASVPPPGSRDPADAWSHRSLVPYTSARLVRTDASERPVGARDSVGASSLQVPADVSARGGTSPGAAASPRASLHDGLLTIDAEGAPLVDAIQAIQRVTGMSVDWSEPAIETVTIHLGPAEPRVVIASLLDGAHYDYMLLARQQHPNSIERIVFTKRRDASGSGPTQETSDVTQQARIPEPAEERPPPVLDVERIREEQRLQLERQFGACIVQGCDAS